MSLGRRTSERQAEFWIATSDLAGGTGHIFYDRLNKLLDEAGFDTCVDDLCRPHYEPTGRPSIPPGRYFRMLLVGDFERIDSQRGIAWQCADSLSLRRFLFLELAEESHDHSSLTNTRNRLPPEVFSAGLRVHPLPGPRAEAAEGGAADGRRGRDDAGSQRSDGGDRTLWDEIRTSSRTQQRPPSARRRMTNSNQIGEFQRAVNGQDDRDNNP